MLSPSSTAAPSHAALSNIIDFARLTASSIAKAYIARSNTSTFRLGKGQPDLTAAFLVLTVMLCNYDIRCTISPSLSA